MSGTLDTAAAFLVTGDVVHKRLRPKLHALRYRVFSLLVDVDRVDEAAALCRWFSRNCFNLLSFYDRDHGAGRDVPIAVEARDIFERAGFDTSERRILLLTYPRVLGRVFNPLSVFFLIDKTGALSALIYEVNNTFGERKCYVVPAGEPTHGVYAQSCAKELFVSPFTPSHGRYSFRVGLDDTRLLVSVALRDLAGPLLKTHTAGTLAPLSSANALSAAARMPLLAAKIVGGIHWEALKLWLKGVPLVRRHRSPGYSVSSGVPPVSTARLALKDDHV